MMAAYLIVDINVADRSKFKEYATAVQSTVEAYGGSYPCKWGIAETMEGEWDVNKIVLIKFETTEQAKAWWNSEEYRPLKALRREASTTRVLLVDDQA
jgi:uncharacterized protein (DUF1330 family)